MGTIPTFPGGSLPPPKGKQGGQERVNFPAPPANFPPAPPKPTSPLGSPKGK